MSDSAKETAGPEVAPSNWNLPNFLTATRIIFIPLFAWLVIQGGDNARYTWWALALFAVLMITDKLDGDIARARGIVTSFGKIADPIADKALMAAALISFNVLGLVPVWMTVVILVREIGITLWRMWELSRGNVVPASKGGKLKTAFQTLAFGLYLIPPLAGQHLLLDVMMWLAMLITVATGVQYLVDARKLKQ